MPIVEDPDKCSFMIAPETCSEAGQSRIHNVSEEKMRTAFLDGPVDVPYWIPSSKPEGEAMAIMEGVTRTSDRAELMERIKRGESPTWVPKKPVRRYWSITWVNSTLLDGFP